MTNTDRIKIIKWYISRDLLEWNGYEVVDDVVIHSRLVVDSASLTTHDEDWQDNDTNFSDVINFNTKSSLNQT